jgi:protein-disulfide isomerase
MSKREELKKRRQAEARRRQLTVVGIVAVAAIGIAAFLIVPQIIENSKPVGEIIAITPQPYPYATGKVLGAPEAQVVIELFSDFQCPACRQFSETVEPQIVSTYIETGQAVRLEYKHYIVVDQIVGGEESRRAAEASECANEQGQFWNYHDLLYTNWNGEGQGAFANNRLKAFAASLTLDTAKFNSCFDSRAYGNVVTSQTNEGVSRGVSGTPTIFVNGAQTPASWAALQTAIETGLGK